MKTAHVIWHHERHDRISDAKEVAGVVLTGWQDADLVVDRLNEADTDRPLMGRNYWKEEFTVLTPENCIRFANA
jgi:hypothetical protein